jgi:hypothetical protein
MYLQRKGSVSVIRAQQNIAGYECLGECDKEGKLLPKQEKKQEWKSAKHDTAEE